MPAQSPRCAEDPDLGKAAAEDHQHAWAFFAEETAFNLE